ncbi:helix-turn-helix transcriptional regulator [Bacillus sp. FDAARGOS_1420]|uniref:helix-turn-helix domain-containing protein n=1 Tax=unclassified Bacillus (in: firmicutes) TaxID=185979 RepID=UPI00214C1A42|nr:helix-turn-helix transcriptional regulator [Bacillus sp. FDAARGOS_1420]
MITCNLKKVLVEKNLRITKVSKDTGISRQTLTALATHTNQGIRFDTLNKLLNYLQVGVEELITCHRDDLSDRGMNIAFPINELTKGLIIRITGLEYLPDVAFIGRFAKLANDVLSVDDVYYDGRTHGTELFSGNSLLVDIPTSEQIFEYGMVCGVEKSEGDEND